MGSRTAEAMRIIKDLGPGLQASPPARVTRYRDRVRNSSLSKSPLGYVRRGQRGRLRSQDRGL
jgi:hypothetical protein